MTAQHSPGPWAGSAGSGIYDARGLKIAGTQWARAIDADEATANARVMVAAPLLLEACRALLARYRQAGYSSAESEAAEAAIAAAEGR